MRNLLLEGTPKERARLHSDVVSAMKALGESRKLPAIDTPG
jgi:hypothetical protein